MSDNEAIVIREEIQDTLPPQKRKSQMNLVFPSQEDMAMEE